MTNLGNIGGYPTESTIIAELKKRTGQSVSELSKSLSLTKMAVLKHLQSLERRGLVERRVAKGAVGRPYYKFYILGAAASAFGSATDYLLDSLVSYIEETGYRNLIVDFLKNRYKEIEAQYKTELSRKKGTERIEALARLRYIENYVPELKKTNGGKYELLEFNCPIFSVSKKFSEACELERRLFQNVLQTNVASTHTQLNGHGTCRFLIDSSIRRD